MIGKAGGRTPGDVKHPVSLARRKGAAMGRHPSAARCTDDTVPSESFRFRLLRCTRCLHGAGSQGIGKCLQSLTNTTGSNPMYTLFVNHAGKLKSPRVWEKPFPNPEALHGRAFWSRSGIPRTKIVLFPLGGWPFPRWEGQTRCHGLPAMRIWQSGYSPGAMPFLASSAIASGVFSRWVSPMPFRT